MPSAMHEVLVSLFRDSPRLAPMLAARAMGIALPEDLEHLEIQVTSAEFAEIDPPEYRADVVLRWFDDKKQENDEVENDRSKGRATREAFIVEVQLDIDANKQFSWPQYVTAARSRFRSRATLMVVTVDERVARWCAQPIVLDLAGSVFRCVVIGPGDIPIISDESEARRWPELAVLSVIAHGHEPGAEYIGLAALAAVHQLDNPRAQLYADQVQDSLNEIARVALGALMEKHHYTYQSDFAKKYYGDGREVGIEEGIEEGYRAVLRRQLQKRFGELPEDAKARIEQADLDTLTTWVDRVIDASNLDDVFAPT